MIRIAISTDAKGHPYNATLIASILRRTKSPVHVRCWCRGFSGKSFQCDSLKVEFIDTDEEVTGHFPSQSGPAAYDRLRVIRDCPDWDRCLVMDQDQIALCDLAPLFDMDLGDHLLAAHMQGPGVDMDYALRVWLKRPMPENWEHVGKYPYFLMPPMLNLAAMRKAGTWDTFLAAHEAFGADEQLSLTAATEGRSLALDKKWNLFPRLHISGNEVPEGVIHWSGWPKPWHQKANVWRPDIWESEKSSWEHLRMGLWRKPVAIEVDPWDNYAANALAKRGWQVKIFNRDVSGFEQAELKYHTAYPDVDASGNTVEEFRNLLQSLGERIDMVRFGTGADIPEWLDQVSHLPEYLVLSGARAAHELVQLNAVGYTEEARVRFRQWPAGGPMPKVLDFKAFQADRSLSGSEEIYLKYDSNEFHPAHFTHRPTQWHSVSNPRNIGILIVATGKSVISASYLIRSLRRNFLPGHDFKIHLFTDSEISESGDLRVIRIDPLPEADRSLNPYRQYQDIAFDLANFDYLFHLDAHLRVVSKVGEEILSDLVAVIHPGHFDQPRPLLPYESRSGSTACVPMTLGSSYFTGAVQGGRTKNYLDAVVEITKRIEIDRHQGITARWRAESHWNRYLIDHAPDLMLSPSYCCFPDSRSDSFEPKISIAPPQE